MAAATCLAATALGWRHGGAGICSRSGAPTVMRYTGTRREARLLPWGARLPACSWQKPPKGGLMLVAGDIMTETWVWAGRDLDGEAGAVVLEQNEAS